MDNKAKKFLDELTKLSNKHQIFIEGCGCCGSPRIYYDNKEINDLIYDKKNKKYYLEGDVRCLEDF